MRVVASKSNTSPGSHASVWSSIISPQPPRSSLELGCFHGDRVFDGQVCVWWPVHCESFHPLLSTRGDAEDFTPLHINVCAACSTETIFTLQRLRCVCFYSWSHTPTEQRLQSLKKFGLWHTKSGSRAMVLLHPVTMQRTERRVRHGNLSCFWVSAYSSTQQRHRWARPT